MSSPPPSLSKLNYLNAAAYAVNCVVTYAVGASNSASSNAAISAKYQTIVTPAGWAFAIWGLIFILQLIWAVVQLLPAYRASPLVLDGVSYYYLGVCGAQVLWTIFFTFELISPSLIAMLSILYCLFKIINSQYKLGGETSTRDYWLLKAPFDIHCGWIIAASLVNINVVLVKWGASAAAQFAAAIVSILLLLLATVYYLHLSRPVFAIPLVLAWACLAIGQELKNPQDLIINTFSKGQISVVRISSWVAMSLVVASTAVRALVMSSHSNSSHDEYDEMQTPAQDPLVS